jgi:predicted RNA methylase
LLASTPTRLTSAEVELIRAATDLGGAEAGGPLSQVEQELVAEAQAAPPTPGARLHALTTAIRAGDDPLGDELTRIRPASARRRIGAFYTPDEIVRPMVEWALAQHPVRVVDAGCGSGRFAVTVARQDPDVEIIAVDLDPLATLLARAHLRASGARQVRVVQTDYTAFALEPVEGRTAFIGNPPYVRHHDLSPRLKAWAATAGSRLGHPVSSLSGLHAYFFLATALIARPGDIGTFITSSEWLDVGYGSVIRQLLLDGLGGLSLSAFHPRTSAFADVMTTAVVVTFEAGAHPETVRLREVTDPDELGRNSRTRVVNRETLAATPRWSALLRQPARATTPELVVTTPGVPLRAIARVHRGQVTGANDFFVMTRARARELGVEHWCRPAITSAEEILHANGVVRDSPDRRLLLVVPRDVDRSAHPRLDSYLRTGEEGTANGHAVSARYVPRHRSPWWHLGRIPAPPIVASYMARRPPAFALNPDGLALLNIGHGLWPVQDFEAEDLGKLVERLNELSTSFVGGGRTYHGGLEKFEPREMENLPIAGGERWVR